MTQRQLEARVKWWQKALSQLGIGHWRCEVRIVDDVQGATGATAGVNPSDYYDTCWMQFNREWLEESDGSTIDEVIVHEWLHVAWRDYQDAIEEAESQMSPSAKFMWHQRVDHEAEGVIERLARTLYHFYSAKVVQ